MEDDRPAEVPLTPSEIAQLRDDGYLLVRRVLPDHVLQPVRKALADVVDGMARAWHDEGLISDEFVTEPFVTRWARIREQLPALRPVTWRRVLVRPAIYELWRRPELTGRMRSLLGDELWAHDTWNGRPREPHAPVQRIHWHQDAPYLRGWRPADGQVYTCWIPLVPVDTHSGCLQVLPGSHRHGLLPRERDEFLLTNTCSEHLSDFVPTTIPAMPGDVLIFTECTVHRALDNESDYVRWSVDIRFGRDSADMRTKARGGYLCRTAGDPKRVESFEQWAAKYDTRTGAIAGQLRAIDAVAARLGPMGRDTRTY